MSYALPLTVNPVFVASGNVRPARVLMRSSTVASTCAESTGTTAVPLGISANRLKYPPGSVEAVGVPYLAQAGEAVEYRGPGQVAEAIAGAAITNPSLPLISDASAQVISATPNPAGSANLRWAVGFPLDLAGALGEIVRVAVCVPFPFAI